MGKERNGTKKGLLFTTPTLHVGRWIKGVEVRLSYKIIKDIFTVRCTKRVNCTSTIEKNSHRSQKERERPRETGSENERT